MTSSSFPDTTEGVPFGYHIYDLSRGIGQRFGPALLGKQMPQGVLHAALVIFGYEYLFEGNISKRPAGCTRFGKNFSFVPAPAKATAVTTEFEFDCWIRYIEMSRWGALAYHLTDHNCIHFVDFATRFLTKGKVRAPDLVAHNIKPVMDTAIGLLLCDVAQIMSGSGMMKVAEEMHQRRICQVQAAHVRRLLQDGNLDPGPWKMIAFGPTTTTTSSSSASALLDYVEAIIESAFAPDRSQERQIPRQRLEQMLLLSSSPPSSSSRESEMEQTGEAVTLVVATAHAFLSPKLCSSFRQLSLLLSVVTRLSTHDGYVQCGMSDLALRNMLIRLARVFFVPLPPELKAQVLEIFCNFMRHPVAGAQMARAVRTWVPAVAFLVGRALLDPSSWLVVHRGSALFFSFVYAHATCNRTAVDLEVTSKGPNHHPIIRLLGPAWFVVCRVVPMVSSSTSSLETENAKTAAEFVDRCRTPENAVSWNLEKELKSNVLSASSSSLEQSASEILERLRSTASTDVYAEEDSSCDAETPNSSAAPSPTKRGASSAAAAGVAAVDAKKHAKEIIVVSQHVLSNVLQTMLLFSLQGRAATRFLQTHKMAASIDVLKERALSAELKNVASGMQMLT